MTTTEEAIGLVEQVIASHRVSEAERLALQRVLGVRTMYGDVIDNVTQQLAAVGHTTVPGLIRERDRLKDRNARALAIASDNLDLPPMSVDVAVLHAVCNALTGEDGGR